MALTISLRVNQSFAVGNDMVSLVWASSPQDFGLLLPCGEVAEVCGPEWKQILPGVRVRASLARKKSGSGVRLMIEAPGLPILRGELGEWDGRKISTGVQSASDVCETCKGAKLLRTKESCSNCNGYGCSQCKGGFVVSKFKCPDC